MLRTVSVLAAILLAGCVSEYDMTPYLTPQPPDVIPWTAKTFTLRYSDWWNTQEDIRTKIVELCGPDIDMARVTPTEQNGSALHPNSLSVACGNVPPPKPDFRGQIVDEGYMISLKPPAISPAPAR